MKTVLTDDLWAAVAPLLPPQPLKPKGGRPRLADLQVLQGILFVLDTGIGWEHLLKELGCGWGMTCWRRWRAWTEAGVWGRLQQVLLDRLGRAEQSDWSRASMRQHQRQGAKRGPRRGRTRPIAASGAASTTS